jgi:hypothetical protein
MEPIAFTILGEPASKANSRELATIGPRDDRRTILRKGDKALGYEADALRQVPARARLRLDVPVRITLRIWYASRRPDLDESIILDVLQDRWKKVQVQPERHVLDTGGRHTTIPAVHERMLIQAGVYRNDRLVHEKHVYWGLDRGNPRSDILVECLEGVQVDAFPEPDEDGGA